MIEINGELCYSPQPPHKYGKGPLGHGMFCQGDLQLWNLMFLSCHQIDNYLLPKANAWEIAKAIPSHVLADAMAALRGQNCLRLFPNLRDALRLHPMQFVDELLLMRYQFMPAYLSDPNWIQTVQARAIEASGDSQLKAWEETNKFLDGILKGGNIQRNKPDV